MKNRPTTPENQTQRLRAIVEVVNNELVIWPIADSDDERTRILDALRVAGVAE